MLNLEESSFSPFKIFLQQEGAVCVRSLWEPQVQKGIENVNVAHHCSLHSNINLPETRDAITQKEPLNTGKIFWENPEITGNLYAQVNRDTSVSAYNDITILIMNIEIHIGLKQNLSNTQQQ